MVIHLPNLSYIHLPDLSHISLPDLSKIHSPDLHYPNLKHVHLPGIGLFKGEFATILVAILGFAVWVSLLLITGFSYLHF
jgi:hypothetical protein